MSIRRSSNDRDPPTLGPGRRETIRSSALLALVGIGYRNLSMSPSSIGPVKATVMALDAGEVTRYVDELLSGTDGAISLREPLMRYAEAHDIPL